MSVKQKLFFFMQTKFSNSVSFTVQKNQWEIYDIPQDTPPPKVGGNITPTTTDSM